MDMLLGLPLVIGLEYFEFLLRQRRRDEIAGIQPGQRTNRIPAVLLAKFLQVGEFHVAPGPDLFINVLQVILVVDIVEDPFPLASTARRTP